MLGTGDVCNSRINHVECLQYLYEVFRYNNFSHSISVFVIISNTGTYPLNTYLKV